MAAFTWSYSRTIFVSNIAHISAKSLAQVGDEIRFATAGLKHKREIAKEESR